jgi:Protein of unknown function with PCYCGC motif
VRRAIILSSSFAAIIALAYLSPMFGSSSAPNLRGAMCIAGHCCCTGRAEAETLAANGANPAQNPGTLDPNQFVGPVREAYKYAGQNPALLAQLHCYCGCDKAEGHQSLLDCYRGMHASACEICTGEVLLAKKMADQGSPVDQIRDAIRRNFAQEN